MQSGENIIEALRAARKAKGLSQRALATRVGLPQSHISKIERGAVDLQLSSLIELARVLELELKLVPRKAVPAVENIIRRMAPASARDQLARTRETLSRVEDVAERLEQYDNSLHLHQIREAAHHLRQIPLPADDLNLVQTAFEPLRHLENVSLDTHNPEDIGAILESPGGRDSLKRAFRILRSIRNQAVHRAAPEEPRARPAYTLDEEDSDG